MPLNKWLAWIISTKNNKLDPTTEASEESFPASDAPAWTGSEHKKPSSQPKESQIVTILKAEHRAIMKAIYLIHEQIEILRKNQPTNINILKDIVQFMRQFVEKAHHTKEERFLFPALEKSKAPLDQCPLNTFKNDHETSLDLLNRLEKLLPLVEKNTTEIQSQLIDMLSQIKDIYTQHTLKEENFIFPLAEEYLSSFTQKTLLKQFEKIDHDNPVQSKIQIEM